MIPNYLTDAFSPIAGEFANTNGPFIEALNFDPSAYPAGLVSEVSELKLPSLNPFQGDMVKTILTANGRAELFTNPHGQAISECRDRLNNLLTSPGTNSSGVDIATALGPSITDLLETLDQFEAHTDRLSGVIEPDTKTAELPTLERALAVGSSINHVHKILDANSAPTNSPVLSMFSSLFAGGAHFDKLKSVLAQPDSQISAADLSDVSQSLTTLAENDVMNYTVAIKKLKRIGVANMVFGMKEKAVESNVISMVTTSFTQGLFANNATQRNAAQVAATEKRLQVQTQGRSNTASFSQDFKTIPDLFVKGGLFEGIQMNLTLYNKLAAMYPPDQPGYFNEFIRVNNLKTQKDLDEFFKVPKLPAQNFNRGKYLFALYLDYLSRQRHGDNSIQAGDFWFFGIKKFGPLSKIMVSDGRFNGVYNNSPDDLIQPQVQDQKGGSWRLMNDDEQAQIFNAIYYNIVSPFTQTGRYRLYFYGEFHDLYYWRGNRFPIPQDPTSGPPGWVYQGGRWFPPEPTQPWPPGVINWILFTDGPDGPHWDPQYDPNYTGPRLPSDAIQPSK